MTTDMINHPSHYANSHPGMECITLADRCGFTIGNTIKYLWRYKTKHDPVEDIRKAAWYLNHAIDTNTPFTPDQTARRMLEQLASQATDPIEQACWTALHDGDIVTARDHANRLARTLETRTRP